MTTRKRTESPGKKPSKKRHFGRTRLPRKTCLVCDDQKCTNQYPSSSKVSSHDHGANTCRACFIKHVESEVDDKPWDQIQCPECSERLEYDEVKNMTSSTHFAKYEQAALRAAIADSADFRYCMSTTCTSGQDHPDGTEEPIFRCQACNHKHCVVCEVPWHEGETCAEYQNKGTMQEQRQNENKQSLIEVQKISKQCPSCKSPIQKTQGCDHMTCSRCRHGFCWLCLADYRAIAIGGNHRHEEGCRHYRANPRVPAVVHAPAQDLIEQDNSSVDSEEEDNTSVDSEEEE